MRDQLVVYGARSDCTRTCTLKSVTHFSNTVSMTCHEKELHRMASYQVAFQSLSSDITRDTDNDIRPRLYDQQVFEQLRS